VRPAKAGMFSGRQSHQRRNRTLAKRCAGCAAARLWSAPSGNKQDCFHCNYIMQFSIDLLKLMLKASGKRGVPQSGIVSPLLSNLYLNEVDKMLGRAQQVARGERWTAVEYARFADDLVILVDSHARHYWLRGAVEQRLREELAKLRVEVSEEKSRRVHLTGGESFGFLGFDFRRVRSRRERWMPLRTPKGKKRTALLRKLKEIFRDSISQPVTQVIAQINPILRGWVQYFGFGQSSRCFSYVRDRVEKKIRRHLGRARERRGHGWKQYSREWLCGALGLFADYRVSSNLLSQETLL